MLLATVRKANDARRHEHLPAGEPLPWFLVNTKLLSKSLLEMAREVCNPSLGKGSLRQGKKSKFPTSRLAWATE